MNASELRAAAAEVADAGAEEFLEDIIRCGEPWRIPNNDLINKARDVARHILATVRADDDEMVSSFGGKLLQMGFRSTSDPSQPGREAFVHDCGLMFRPHCYGDFRGRWDIPSMSVDKLNLGQVRDLCRVLGVPLSEA